MSDSAANLEDGGVFIHWTTEKIRFQDIDRYNHVNNVKFAVYAESARLEFLQWLAPESLASSERAWVIAQIAINFRAPAHYPGQVRIGTRLARVGRSSVGLGQGMFVDDTCVATAESVLVLIDADTARAAPLPDNLRALLSSAKAG